MLQICRDDGLGHRLSRLDPGASEKAMSLANFELKPMFPDCLEQCFSELRLKQH